MQCKLEAVATVKQWSDSDMTLINCIVESSLADDALPHTADDNAVTWLHWHRYNLSDLAHRHGDRSTRISSVLVRAVVMLCCWNVQPEFLDSVAINIHRIDKDVQRCDRNYSYFMVAGNLDKLRNVMCTYVI